VYQKRTPDVSLTNEFVVHVVLNNSKSGGWEMAYLFNYGHELFKTIRSYPSWYSGRVAL